MALFFTITGFLLVRSVEREKFFPWWIKKVIRLYIPLTIVNLVTVIIGYRKASLLLFVFPINTLWYVPVIALLYIPYYWVMRAEKYNDNNNSGYKIAILLTILIYVITYLVRYRDAFFVGPEIGFRALYGFVAMLLGSVVYEKRDAVVETKKGFIYALVSVFGCACFLATKLMIGRAGIVMKMQFLTQVFGVTFAFFALLAGLCYEHQIERFIKTWIGRATGIISKCSLEIFLVQFAIIQYLKPIRFPINLIWILFVIVICAWEVHMVSDWIYKKIPWKRTR